MKPAHIFKQAIAALFLASSFSCQPINFSPVLNKPVLFPQVTADFSVQQASSFRSSLVNQTFSVSWAYFFYENTWYIANSNGEVYFLNAIKQGNAGWGRIGEGKTGPIGRLNFQTHQIQISSDIVPNSDRFYDAGWREYTSNSSIKELSRKIQGRQIDIAWYFFMDPASGSWFIVNLDTQKPTILRFALNAEQTNYDWKATGMENTTARFNASSSGLSVSFADGSTSGIPANVQNAMDAARQRYGNHTPTGSIVRTTDNKGWKLSFESPAGQGIFIMRDGQRLCCINKPQGVHRSVSWGYV